MNPEIICGKINNTSIESLKKKDRRENKDSIATFEI